VFGGRSVGVALILGGVILLLLRSRNAGSS